MCFFFISANTENDTCLFIQRLLRSYRFVFYNPSRNQHFRFGDNFMRAISVTATNQSRGYHNINAAGNTAVSTWEQIYKFLNDQNDPFNRTDLRRYNTTSRKYD